MFTERLLNKPMKRKNPTQKPLKTGFAALPVYTLEVRGDRGLLAEIPFSTEPIASGIQRAERAGAIAILIALLLQMPNKEENFINLAEAVGADCADQIRDLAIEASTDAQNVRCRLLDERKQHIQVLHTRRPDYAVQSGSQVSIEQIAELAKESAA